MTVKYCDIIALSIVQCPGRRTPWGFVPKGAGEEGYGKKIHTEYEVKLRGQGERWYKVYAGCFSNVSSYYTAKGYCHDWQLNDYRDRVGAR